MSGPADPGRSPTADGVLAELAGLRAVLRGESEAATVPRPEARTPGDAVGPPGERRSGLDLVQHACGLSRFERSVLLLACGPSLESAVADELLLATGASALTFGSALGTLPGAHWSALAPEAGLRRWLLLAPEDPSRLLTSRLVVDERILHLVAGLETLDDRLARISAPVPTVPELPASWRPVTARLARQWSAGAVRLDGVGPGEAAALAAEAAECCGRRLREIAGADLPSDPAEARTAVTLLDREARLGPVAWWIDLDDAPGETARRYRRLLASVTCTALTDTAAGTDRTRSVAVPAPRHAERDRLVGTRAPAGVVPGARWGDLVLPDAQLDQLRAVAAAVRHRGTVLDDWGFAGRRTRGLGTSALFTGPSGTGKTFAAEVLAGELGRELVRVDLSQVVSKYIGETEKHLARLFDGAEATGSVLFFDEADALFGKRTVVRDSHDRYANIEVSYLLQRLESFSGLALLASNARAALDTAFLRRLTAVVAFPHPDAGARRALWERAFPAHMPRGDLRLDALARTDATGAVIMSAALAAAYLAAEAGVPVDTSHVVRALEWELAKSGRPGSGTLTAGVRT